MFDDVFNSVKTSFRERFVNPFMGTFLLVFIARNWTVFYAILAFKQESLKQRLEFINLHFSHNPLGENVCKTVLFTFATLIVSQLFSSLAKLILSFFDRILNPKLIQLTDRGSVVKRVDYNTLKLENKQLQQSIEKNQEADIDFRNKFSDLTKDRDELNKQKATLTGQLETEETRRITLEKSLTVAINSTRTIQEQSKNTQNTYTNQISDLEFKLSQLQASYDSLQFENVELKRQRETNSSSWTTPSHSYVTLNPNTYKTSVVTPSLTKNKDEGGSVPNLNRAPSNTNLLHQTTRKNKT